MTELEVHMFPCLDDNYGYLIHDASGGETATVDTPDAEAIERELDRKGWRLTHILNTHHHFDHAGGNEALKASTGCTIVGPRADAERIPGIDVTVGEGDEFTLGHHRVVVHDTPGHTRGHIVYHIPDARIAFVGDTLFAMGCGRLFEGTPEQMWSSLSKLLAWPEDTLVYCAHEYTQANARFALSVEPQNADLQTRAKEVDETRRAGRSTIPTTIGLERRTNPFLRPDSADLQSTLGLTGADPVTVFAETRRRKDHF